jgi:hypothetical protein
MRFSTIALIAGSMTAAAPAFAQNTAEPATNVDVNATMAATNEMTAPTTNEMVASPAEMGAPADTAPAPIPARDGRSFPWGVLGLLGLIGLLGKRSRTG